MTIGPIFNAIRNEMRPTTRLCLAFALLVGPLLLKGEELRAQEVGLVLKLKGEWLLNGKAVAPGETLPPGGRIYYSQQKAKERAPLDYITVIFLDGKIESRSWDKIESWNDPIQLPAAEKEAPSRWKRIVTAVMGVFPGHPEKYAQMSVRGSAADLRDAVVDLKDGQVNLAPAFTYMKKGAYLLLFKPISATKASVEEAAPKPVPFDWDPNAPVPLQANDLRPGLYALNLLSVQNEDHQPTGTQAWILVSDHARYEKTATAFQQCITLTEQWGKEAPIGATRSFVRAYLDSLALQESL